MENYINTIGLHHNVMGKKVLIATMYNAEPVMLAITKLGPDRVYLLIHDESDKDQDAAVKLITNSLGKVIDIKLVKTPAYDIVKVARKAVEVIDMQPTEDDIYVNITGSRKTKAIGLLFAAYCRHDRVKRIGCNPEEDENAVVYLPRLSFKLTESQKTILEAIDKGKYSTIGDMAKNVELSTAMLYRAIDELKDMDLITTDEGLKLTDAGKIARL